MANAGAVTRAGHHVLRPSNPHTPTVHRFLGSLPSSGFDGASVPVGVDADGRERLEFVEGDVPLVPYPHWARTDAALGSIARLMRRFHDASARFAHRESDTWSPEMQDPRGGPIVCHNDVCLENVVFRRGHAVALLDFDFAAPGRPVHDVACFARMCVPIDDESRVRFGWHVDPEDTHAGLPARLRLVADEYGLDADGRGDVVDALDESIRTGGRFLERQVATGHRGFTEMWNSMGGMRRFDRRRTWWATTRHLFEEAMR